jgi:recombination protein RecT
MANTPTETSAVQPVVVQKEITSQVLAKIQTFMQAGELKMPPDYSPENALKGAMLVLQEAKDRAGKPVLEICSKTSIAQALLKMCVEGLSPLKKQGYFIPYGTDLQWSRSYQGSMALAKRVGGVTDIVSNVIYQDDLFEYSVDVETGYKKIVHHNQKVENIDNAKIKGAYAVVIYSDGRKDLEVMTFAEIKQAWMQGATKGNSGAHQNFTQEMCKKTVINRACKNPINSSSDFNLLGGDDEDDETIKTPIESLKTEVFSESVAQEVEFTEVKEEKQPEEKSTQKEEIKSLSDKLNESKTEDAHKVAPEIKF